jgi:hypothetical protein
MRVVSLLRPYWLVPSLLLLGAVTAFAQDFTENFEVGNLSNWTVVSGNYQMRGGGHGGVWSAAAYPGSTALVRIRKSNFNACVGTFTVWFKLAGTTVDSRIRICVNQSGTQWYGVWFNPPGTDNPVWMIERSTNNINAGFAIASGPVPQIPLNTWYKLTLRREGNGRLTATVNDASKLTVVDNTISQAGGMEIPAYQDATNLMQFDDVSAVNTDVGCATVESPLISPLDRTFRIAGTVCNELSVDTAISICNIGTGKLWISSAKLYGADTAEWRIIGYSPFFIPAGQCSTIVLRYTPKRPFGQQKAAYILLTTNADNVATTSGPAYTLTARKDTIRLAAVPVMDFGEIPCTVAATDTFFTVRNVSSIATAFSVNSPAQPFLVTDTGAGGAVAVGAGRSIRLRYVNPGTDTSLSQMAYIVDSCGTTDSVLITARVRTPHLEATSELDFGTLSCDDSRTVKITVRNTGSLAATAHLRYVFPPFFPSASPDFTVPANRTVSVAVVFRPTAPGTFSDTISIHSDECGGMETSVVLTGRKDSLGVTISGVKPNVIEFGVLCNTQVPKDTTFDVVNVSTIPVQFSLAVAGPFSIVGNPASAPLDTGARRTVTLRFTGTADGEYQGTLVVRDSCGDVATIAIAASVGRPILFADSAADFGDLVCDSATDRTVTIHNHGVLTAHVTIQTSGASAFSARPPVADIAPGDSLLAVVHFTPGTPGTFFDTLVVNNAACADTTIRIALSGRKATVGIEIAGTAGNVVDFGALCNSLILRDTTIEIVNRSNVTNPFSLFAAAPFSIVGTPDSTPLGPGERRQVTVRMNAAPNGAYHDTVLARDACGNIAAVALSALVGGPLLVATASLDFGALSCDSAQSITIAVVNQGTLRGTVHVLPIAAPFLLVNGADVILDPDSAHTFTVMFLPTQAGTYVDTVTIVSNDCLGSMTTVVLVGRKDSIGITVDGVRPNMLDFGALCPAHIPKDTTFDVVNTSSVPISFSIATTGGFTIAGTPAATPIAAGDRRRITVRFAETPDSLYQGTLAVRDSCGDVDTLRLTARVERPRFVVPARLDTVVCVNTPVNFVIPVFNAGTQEHTLMITGSACVPRPSMLTIPGGGSGKTLLPFAGSATSTSDSCAITITDECGGAHAVVARVTVRRGGPVTLSLRADTSRTHDSRIAVVEVRAETPENISPLDTIAFRITHEITALEFLGLDTAARATVSQLAPNAYGVSLPDISADADSIVARVKFRTLIGSTLDPFVLLDSVSTGSLWTISCLIASGSDGVTVPLLAHGCELRTLTVRPYTTAIQSVFPNPSALVAAVEYSILEEVPAHLTLTNALGQVVRALDINAAKPGRYVAQISTRDIESGLYVLSLRAGTLGDARLVGVFR